MSSTPSSSSAAAGAAGASKMEQLLGNTLWKDAKGTTGTTADLFRNKQFVALYFSASWCPPCKGTKRKKTPSPPSHPPFKPTLTTTKTPVFSPILADFYNECAKNDGVEIVYMSSDHSLVDITAYYGKMPWLAIPYDEQGNKLRSNLASLFSIRGIPSLIVLDVATGQYITADARNHIQQAAQAQKTEPATWKQVIQQWKSIPPVPIAEGVAQNAPGFLRTIVMTILRNPMYLMAAFYLVKYAMRKYQQQHSNPTSVTLEDTTSAETTAADVIGDDEF
jgi:nucleoredoxin